MSTAIAAQADHLFELAIEDYVKCSRNNGRDTEKGARSITDASA
jgi:hypothetical protein